MRLPIKEIWHLGLPLSLGLVIQMVAVFTSFCFYFSSVLLLG